MQYMLCGPPTRPTRASLLFGGVYVLDVATLDDAVPWTKRMPFTDGTKIEIRRVTAIDEIATGGAGRGARQLAAVRHVAAHDRAARWLNRAPWCAAIGSRVAGQLPVTTSGGSCQPMNTSTTCRS